MLGYTLATSKGFCGPRRLGTLGTNWRSPGFLMRYPQIPSRGNRHCEAPAPLTTEAAFGRRTTQGGQDPTHHYFGKHCCSSVLVIPEPHTVHGAWGTVRGTPQGRSSLVVMTDVPLPQNPPRADPGQQFWHWPFQNSAVYMGTGVTRQGDTSHPLNASPPLRIKGT